MAINKIKKNFILNLKKIKDWCNANQGVLAGIAILVTIFTYIPFKDIDFSFANPFLRIVFDIITLKIQIPIYSLLILGIVTLLYLSKLKKRYTPKGISESFLIGTWKNEWTINGHTDSEIFTVTKELHYIMNNEYIFSIVDFKHNPLTNELKFIKAGVRPNDNRKHKNTLKIVNNDVLTGTEDEYQIKYTRISN